MKTALLVFGMLSLSSAISEAAVNPTALQTVAERSGYKRTGRYDEVEKLCPAYEAAWPQFVKCAEFGRTPEGRPLLALIVSKTGVLTPEQAREKNIPVMVAQGGIHAGEIDGKDAGFLAIRELLQDKTAPRSLESYVFVFVPVFNVDGHERFGRWQRPNQVGPEEMGWRTTGQNLNLNRDYAKADAPEMQAMLRLLDAWDPILYVDLHVTDGAQFEHDVANLIEPFVSGDPTLQKVGRETVTELNAALAQKGSLPLDFYPSFMTDDDPASGFEATPSQPRFSQGYWSLHNRLALLVETHSWKDYPTRVRITYNILVKLSEQMAKNGKRWKDAAREADERASGLGGQEVVLDYGAKPEGRTIEFRGYAYTREPSAVSGGLVTHYDPTKPQIWRIPLRDTLVPTVVTKAPTGGYVVMPAHATWMAERLALHGVRFSRVEKGTASAAVETFRADSATPSASTFEGRTFMSVQGVWKNDKRELPAGALYVPIAQPNARLVLALLEPQAPDSFLSWGFFNAAFERKEYMEAYVAEQLGKEMLAKDAKLAAEFNQRLASDPKFAADPQARLDFFFRRSPSFDDRLNLYPVYRVAAPPANTQAP